MEIILMFDIAVISLLMRRYGGGGGHLINLVTARHINWYTRVWKKPIHVDLFLLVYYNVHNILDHPKAHIMTRI